MSPRQVFASSALLAVALLGSGCEQSPSDPPVDAAGDGPMSDGAIPDGAPDGAIPDTGSDATPDATPSDLHALCGAASTAEGCAAVQLPPPTGCEDCWLGCLWFEQHRVRPVDDETCAVEASEARCVLVGVGEEGSTPPSEMCLGGGEGWGGFVYEVRDDGVWLGAVSTGRVVDDDIHRCTFLGGHPACRCPCLAGYPDPACERPDQYRPPPAPPSGVEVCRGVPPHRFAAAECTPPDAIGCTHGRGVCRADDDCPMGDRCTDTVDGQCACVSPCTVDADCGAGRACLCSHGMLGGHGALTRCVIADCSTDADCAEGEVCAVSYAPGGSRCAPERLACRRTHAFCDGVVCQPDEYCTYDPAAAGWTCREGCRF